jgi:predicted site-specific integrase-resolvase
LPTRLPPTGRLVLLQDAVRELGVNRSTLYRWIKAGSLTPVYIAMDRRTYLDRRELARLRRPQKKRPKPGAG